ncbi:MAG: response regulator [Lachnospiraceae bacterium]|nr:response regulator [Lachnospiraceae bacterium]
MNTTKKSIMLIGEKETFLIRVLLKKLTEADLDAFFVSSSIDEIQLSWPNTSILTYYLDPSEDIKPDLMHFLNDKLVQDDKQIALIGEKSDVLDMQQYLSRDIVLEVFYRPLDTNAYIQLLSEHIDESDQQKKRTILVVDDDPTYLGVVRDWLRNDYQVAIVGSGLQAIKWLSMNTADLILLDYEMPITSGPQVLQMLRSDPDTESIPIFFLTGRSDKESVMEVMALKPQNYLLKTIEREELLEKLNLFFSQKKARGL